MGKRSRIIISASPDSHAFIKESYKEKVEGGSMNYSSIGDVIKDVESNTTTNWKGFKDCMLVDPDPLSGIKIKYLNVYNVRILYYIFDGFIYYSILTSNDSGVLEFRKTDDLEKIIKELHLL